MTRKFAEFMENNKDEINEVCDWGMNGRCIHEERLKEMNDRVLELHDQFKKETGYDHDASWLYEQMLNYYNVESIPDDNNIPHFYYCNISKYLNEL